MLAGLSASQMAEWEAFYALEPWGGLRDDLRAGKVCATVANAAPFRGGGKARMPADYFPTLAEPRRKPTPAEIRDKANAFFAGVVAAHGG